MYLNGSFYKSKLKKEGTTVASLQVSNELAREYLKDCDVTIEDYSSVYDFIKDILLYNEYLVDKEAEFAIAIDEEK